MLFKIGTLIRYVMYLLLIGEHGGTLCDLYRDGDDFSFNGWAGAASTKPLE